MPVTLACQYAGVHRDTYYAECGRADSELNVKAEEARAEGAMRNLLLLQRAASEDWRAADRWLTIAFPEDFGKRRFSVEHSGEVTSKPDEIKPEFVASVLRELNSIGDLEAGATPD